MSHTHRPLTANVVYGDGLISDVSGDCIGESYRCTDAGRELPAIENARLWAASPIALELAAFVLERRPPDQCRAKAQEFLDRAHGKETR